MRRLWVSMKGLEMGNRSSSAHRMRPVSPRPPTVAANQAECSAGLQTISEPSERNSPSLRTWWPKLPAT